MAEHEPVAPNTTQTPREVSSLFDQLAARWSDPDFAAAQDARAAAAAKRDAKPAVDLANAAELAASLGARYRPCRLNNFVISADEEIARRQREAVARLKWFCEHIVTETRAGHGLVLYGPVGTGKDHLMAAALRVAALAGLSCRWVSGTDLYATWRDQIDDGGSERRAMQHWLRPSILALSDPQPPTGSLREHQASKLKDLVDKRYRECRPTWATINAKDYDDASLLLTSPIVDRLRDGAHAIFCNWPSARKPGGAQ